ncbi:MAG: hypothetical protein Q9190_006001 [Brigantiaea leucoxantha]
MPWGDDWVVDHGKKRICPRLEDVQLSTLTEQSNIIERTLRRGQESGRFKVLEKWRNELYTIHGPNHLVVMERSGSPLFGIATYGVHMTTFVNAPEGIKIWVPRRAKGKTYGGMLDNTVAGGLSTGEDPFECIIREAAEEASFPEQLIRTNTKSCGIISYFHVRDARAGGETGLLQPEVQFVYDMEVGPEVVPRPNDDEVEDFRLWTVKEVQEALAEGMFKPNCAALLLDFFVRHGILTLENEKDYVEISTRLHRKLPFLTSSSI